MIVLDTCAIVWDAIEPAKLSSKARKAIEDASARRKILISDISLWEIAMLIARNRIEVNESPSNFLRLLLDARPYQISALTPEIAELAVTLDERVNGDPADRIILATSMANKAALVTADRNLRTAGIADVIW